MKSKYKREISKDYLRPLSSFRYNPCYHPHVATNKQLVLAKNLSRSYGIADGNVLRMIMYTEIALSHSADREIELSYSDLSEIIEFEQDPVPIERITFQGGSKSFEITNPHIIDNLYYSIIDFFNFQEIIRERGSDKERSSDAVIRSVAAELFNALTNEEKISEGKSYCIIGYIFCLYNIHLKPDGPILSEDQYNLLKKEKQNKTETYLQYLAGRVKQYVS